MRGQCAKKNLWLKVFYKKYEIEMDKNAFKRSHVHTHDLIPSNLIRKLDERVTTKLAK